MTNSSSTGGPDLPDAAAVAAAGASTEAVTQAARDVAPVVWLIGKVQSGKTSIIRTITDCNDAEIGTGFKPCTKTARVFDFPLEAPILRFLDTRGIDEVAYDPTEDLLIAERSAHLILVTMRAMDVGQERIVDAVAAVRRRHPEWPIVVAQTCLHEGYERGRGHLLPYPFDGDERDDAVTDRLPRELLRCLEHQRGMFSTVPGKGPIRFVPLDFTLPGDGLDPADYGLQALTQSLVDVASAAMRIVLAAMPGAVSDQRGRQMESVILGHAMAAAGSDLVPVAGMVAVSVIQARLLNRLGNVYKQTWDRRALAEFAAALGSGVAARTLTWMGARQLAKLVPFYGQTIAAAASAAMSFAVTYALGKAAAHYLRQKELGRDIASAAEVYQTALRDALRMARTARADTVDRRSGA